MRKYELSEVGHQGLENCYRELVTWVNVSLPARYDFVFKAYPNNEAIIFQGQRITFGEMEYRVNSLCWALLKMGVKKGDRVAIWMPNWPEHVYARYAAWNAGFVAVPMNTRYRAHDAGFVLKSSEANTLIMVDEFLGIDYLKLLEEICPEVVNSRPGKLVSETLPDLKNIIVYSLQGKKYDHVYKYEEIMETGSDYSNDKIKPVVASVQTTDLASILYTSGTTAAPKGVIYTHRMIMASAVRQWARMQYGPDQVSYCALPIFHVFGGEHACFQPHLYGMKVVMEDVFNAAEFARLIEKERITHLHGVPTFFVELTNLPDLDKYDLTSARTGIIGGAQNPIEVCRKLVKISPEQAVAYGCTEQVGGFCSVAPDDPPDIKATTVGKPWADMEIRICDRKTRDPNDILPAGEEGELWMRGLSVTPGFFKNPEETARCIKYNWQTSEDLGVMDPETGNITITGRIKEMFTTGGFNVAPAEVEDVIYKHPKIKSVYVAGVPDERLGEVGMAFIDLKPGETMSEKEIIDFCQGKVANFKVPRYVRFMRAEDLPMTATGKIQKFKLSEIGKKELGME